MAASAYHLISNEVEYSFFRHNLIFRHACMYKEPKMTKQWNYCTFVQMLYSHLRYTVFFLLLALILSELHENSRRKDLKSYRKKVHQKFVQVTSLFWLHALLLLSFLSLFSGASDNLPFPQNPLYLNLCHKEVY